MIKSIESMIFVALHLMIQNEDAPRLALSLVSAANHFGCRPRHWKYWKS